VEVSAETFVDLASGRVPFADAVTNGDVRASGIRADLSDVLPVLA
jgi:hypothetical protein